jgi:hypothetical protein
MGEVYRATDENLNRDVAIKDLAERLKRGAIPVDEPLAIAKQIAQSLGAPRG